MTDRDGILAFRSARHSLARRQARANVASVAAVAGIRDAQGSGTLALHARLKNVSATTIADALLDGTLVEVISARGTMTLVPTADVAVFTVGTLPSDEESFRSRLKPALPVIDRAGYTATDAVHRAIDVARAALAGGPLDIGGLSGAMTQALPELSPMCRGRCRVEHIEAILFDLVGEAGVWRQQRPDGSRKSERLFVPLDVAGDDPVVVTAARKELTRRYLQAYGPSTANDFADWCGIAPADARRRFEAVDAVEIEPRHYVVAGDERALRKPPASAGVRLVPPRDPYLLARDRVTLVPDRTVQKVVWTANPSVGLVLAAGRPSATWKAKKSGSRLGISVAAFESLAPDQRESLEQEASAIAQLRGCETAEVRIS